MSTLSERKIDYFESRLANIETMLRDLAVSLNSSRSPSTAATESGLAGPLAQIPAGDNTDILYGAEDDDDAVSAFEGDTSMTAQTVFASAFLENAVTTKTLPPDLDHDMQSALSSLQQIVSRHNRPSAHESRFVNAKSLPKGGIRELPMPPAQVVITMLREVKGVAADTPPNAAPLARAYISRQTCRW